MEIVDFVIFVSCWSFVLPESIICLLTLSLQDGAFAFGFVVCIALVQTCVGTGIVEYVTLTLRSCFVDSVSVIR